jgi:hypothetical protein
MSEVGSQRPAIICPGFVVRDVNGQALWPASTSRRSRADGRRRRRCYRRVASAPPTGGGVGAATAASLPRVLIMASSMRAAGEVRRARSAAARTVVFMSLFPLSRNR